MKQRTGIITGASRGLGHALARSLAATGWRLVIDGRNEADLAAAEYELSRHTELTALAGDITNPDHARALVEAAGALGPLELVVNNASTLGASPLPRLADFPIDRFVRVFEVNVAAPLRLIQLALPALRANGGTIVNVTSDAAVAAYEGWGGYGSSKSALEQLSNVLAAEEPDVRVLCVDPGDMRTRMHQAAFPGEDISDRPPPESRVPSLMRLLESEAPSGRYAVADFEVAASGSTA